MTSEVYIKKLSKVRVFRMTKEHQMSNENWPTRMHDAWNMPPNKIGALGRCNNDPNYRMWCNTSDRGCVMINFGQYLVTDGKNAYVMDKRELYSSYVCEDEIDAAIPWNLLGDTITE